MAHIGPLRNMCANTISEIYLQLNYTLYINLEGLKKAQLVPWLKPTQSLIELKQQQSRKEMCVYFDSKI